MIRKAVSTDEEAIVLTLKMRAYCTGKRCSGMLNEIRKHNSAPAYSAIRNRDVSNKF